MSFLRSLFKSDTSASKNFEVLELAAYKKAVINKKVQLVDVRTPAEFRKGHLAKAQNIDFYDKKGFAEAFDDFDKSKPVYIYCRSGFRSKKAASRLLQMGFSKVYDLKGGLNNWR